MSQEISAGRFWVKKCRPRKNWERKPAEGWKSDRKITALALSEGRPRYKSLVRTSTLTRDLSGRFAVSKAAWASSETTLPSLSQVAMIGINAPIAQLLLK